jgi:hypothetical protein
MSFLYCESKGLQANAHSPLLENVQNTSTTLCVCLTAKGCCNRVGTLDNFHRGLRHNLLVCLGFYLVDHSLKIVHGYLGIIGIVSFKYTDAASTLAKRLVYNSALTLPMATCSTMQDYNAASIVKGYPTASTKRLNLLKLSTLPILRKYYVRSEAEPDSWLEKFPAKTESSVFFCSVQVQLICKDIRWKTKRFYVSFLKFCMPKTTPSQDVAVIL